MRFGAVEIRVLIVEPSQALALAWEDYLREVGFLTVRASNLEELIATLTVGPERLIALVGASPEARELWRSLPQAHRGGARLVASCHVRRDPYEQEVPDADATIVVPEALTDLPGTLRRLYEEKLGNEP